ncbi:DNA primase [bacterium]|nr:DNA primase [bacterium]
MVDPVQEIKSKLGIVELVSDYVQLKKAGAYFKGLSPFTNEKTPSFYVSPQKDIAFCFSTNQGGDIFTFYQLVENCNFQEALKDLALRTGVNIETMKMPTSKDIEKKNRVFDLQEYLSKIFQKELSKSKDNLNYLRQRGIKDSVIKEFDLGLCNMDSKVYVDLLSKKGFSQQEMIDSGSFSDKAGYLECKFKDRLMIPISDSRGNVIAFGGRKLLESQKAKYLNSPETFIYKKNQTLYGFDKAKERIRETKTVILVEGYFDQIACYQNGFKNTVAVCGTALTENQVKLLSRFAERFVFCLDNDKAGKRAIANTSEIIAKFTDQIYIMNLGEFKDPADCFNEDPSVFVESMRNPLNLISFYQALYLPEKKITQNNTKSLQDFLESVFKILFILSDEIISEIWIREIADLLDLPKQKLLSKYSSFRKNQKVEVDTVKSAKFDLKIGDYLALLVYSDIDNLQEYKSLILDNFNYLKEIEFFNLLKTNEFDLFKINLKFLDVKLMELELKGLNFEKLDLRVEIEKCFSRISSQYKKQRIAEIQRQLSRNDNKNNLELLKELQNLMKK